MAADKSVVSVARSDNSRKSFLSYERHAQSLSSLNAVITAWSGAVFKDMSVHKVVVKATIPKKPSGSAWVFFSLSTISS